MQQDDCKPSTVGLSEVQFDEYLAMVRYGGVVYHTHFTFMGINQTESGVVYLIGRDRYDQAVRAYRDGRVAYTS